MGDFPWDEIFERVLGNSNEVQDENILPCTGVGIYFEKKFSACNIRPFDAFGYKVRKYLLVEI